MTTPPFDSDRDSKTKGGECLSSRQALGCAFHLRCPKCQKAKVFRNFFQLHEYCPRCHLAIHKHDSGDGPAVFLIFILGALIVPLAIWFDLGLHLPLWFNLAANSGLILGITLLTLRPVKAYVLALQYRHGQLKDHEEKEDL